MGQRFKTPTWAPLTCPGIDTRAHREGEIGRSNIDHPATAAAPAKPTEAAPIPRAVHIPSWRLLRWRAWSHCIIDTPPRRELWRDDDVQHIIAPRHKGWESCEQHECCDQDQTRRAHACAHLERRPSGSPAGYKRHAETHHGRRVGKPRTPRWTVITHVNAPPNDMPCTYASARCVLSPTIFARRCVQTQFVVAEERLLQHFGVQKDVPTCIAKHE